VSRPLITYVKGDATYPAGPGTKVICHVVNDIFRWGRGFVLALSKRWSEPEAAYRAAAGKMVLGQIQSVRVAHDIIVVNMMAQHGVEVVDGVPPIRYTALEQCLNKLADMWHPGYSLHTCKFGAGLAGGNWQVIEQMITDILCPKNIPVTIYEL
jgi:hypothetical protein